MTARNVKARASAPRRRDEVAHPSQLRRDYRDGTSLGYRAATEARRSPKVIGPAGSADWHLRSDRETLVRISRGYARDSALFGGIHRVARDNILGSGFALQARTANKNMNARLEELWKERCRRPEVRGIFTWKRVVELVLDGLFVAGDVAAIKLASTDDTLDGKLQLVESEQIDAGRSKSEAGNRIEGGVEVDRFGRMVAFYVKDFADAGGSLRGRARRLRPEDVIFPAARARPSQTRGVPPLVASFPDLERLDDILSSEAAAWQLLSRLAVKRKQIDSPELAFAQSKPDDNKIVETEDLGSRIHDVGYSLIFNCQPGEDIEGIEHNIPGTNFERSVRVFLRLLGLPLGLPLELILLDWSQTNYSSARASLEQAFVTFARWQELLASDFCSPDYEWQVRRWVADGLVPDRPDVTKHEWIRPQFPWLDQLKECQAWGMKLDRGLVTHAEALKSVNRDRGEWLEARKAEILEAFAAADAVQAGRENPDPELWRHFAGLSVRAPNVAKKGEETPTSERPPADEEEPGGDEEDTND